MYFNPHTLEHKKLVPITELQIKEAFGGNNIKVYTRSMDLIEYLKSLEHNNQAFLMMTSGNFDGIDFNDLALELV